MPKNKTHRGAAKRFRLTASGKVKFKHAHLRHCLEHKKKSTKNHLQKTGIMFEADAKKVRKLLANNG
jgi:large subunit ribosomal protein L35